MTEYYKIKEIANMRTKEEIREKLEKFLDETEQRGNLSMWGLMGYCIGYFGAIDSDILDVVHDMVCDGEVKK